MRSPIIAAASFAILVSCEDTRLLDTEPETVTLDPVAIQVSRHVSEDRPDICPFLTRGGLLPRLYIDWMNALPDGDKNEVFAGRTDWENQNDLCGAWVHNLYQGIVLFDLSNLPEGPVTGAQLIFDKTRLRDPAYPAVACFFKVGALTEPTDWRSRSVTRVDTPTLYSDREPSEIVKGRHFQTVAPREDFADVSRVVGSWDLDVYPNLGFVITPTEDQLPEDTASCGYRVENIRLEVTVARPIES